MPRKPRCGGKPVNGKKANNNAPVPTKNPVDTILTRWMRFCLVAIDTLIRLKPKAVWVQLINLPYFIQKCLTVEGLMSLFF